MTNGSRLGEWLLPLLALLGLVVGVWAFFAGPSFFETVASDTGPFNGHLTRDVGAAFLTSGFGYLLAWRARRQRAALTLLATAFPALHALGHLIEIATGDLGREHLWMDLPGVFVPALLGAALALLLARHERALEGTAP